MSLAKSVTINFQCGFVADFDFPIEIKSAGYPQQKLTCCEFEIRTAGQFLCGFHADL